MRIPTFPQSTGIGILTGHSNTGLEKSENPTEANVATSFASGKEYAYTSDGDKIKAAIDNNKCD